MRREQKKKVPLRGAPGAEPALDLMGGGNLINDCSNCEVYECPRNMI